MKLLFDASSIFNSLVERRPEPMIDQYTLDFTRYELLNVIWKHYTLLHTFNREAFDALLLSSVNIHAMETAVTNGISLYDSAYISLAKENQCSLVTENNMMRKISRELGIPVVSIKDV